MAERYQQENNNIEASIGHFKQCTKCSFVDVGYGSWYASAILDPKPNLLHTDGNKLLSRKSFHGSVVHNAEDANPIGSSPGTSEYQSSSEIFPIKLMEHR